MAVRDRGLAQLGLLALFAALATLHTWPMPGDPAHLTRLDNDDTAFNTWVIAWVAHALAGDPLRLFDAPIFYPARDALAFSEHMFAQGVMSAPLHWAGLSPVLVYNVMVWAGFALSGFAMALLMRAWTGSTSAGAVAGCLYAFNAHLLTRYAHLQALHMQFFPLVLYALDRVLREAEHRTPGAWRAAALLTVGVVAQALCSNYTLVLMTLALLAAVIVRRETWRPTRALLLRVTVAAAAAALLLLPFVLPYVRVRDAQGMVRTIDDVRSYSAGLADYLVTAGRLHYEWWSYRLYEGRTALFPGVLASLLALVAVARGTAWSDARARMALAFGLAGFALSFGAALPGYEWLHTHVPLLEGIRVVARFGLLVLIAIAILAGFGVAILQRRWGQRSWWPAVVVAIVAIVTLEAMRAPLAMHRFDGIPAAHDRLRDDEVRAIVVFPLYPGRSFHSNAPYMLHQTRHWKPMLNAYSSYAPPEFLARAERFQAFPAEAVLDEMRQVGFTHVVLHRAPLAADYGEAAVDALRAHPGLQFVFEDDGVIVYRLR